MFKFVVTIEYADGNQTKFTVDSWDDVKNWLDPRLDSEHSAKLITRVVIIPRVI